MVVKKSGFTLIEVTLFLAITALLFVGLAVGINGAMTQQRYNDSVQNFAEFLRTTYSQVLNVEGTSNSGGSGDMFAYGKLLRFMGDGKVESYTVTGGDGKNSTGTIWEKLNSTGAVIGQGITEDYKLKWGAKVQYKNDDVFSDFKGAILIVRDPAGGGVSTFIREASANTPSFYNEYSKATGDWSIFRGEPIEFVLCVNNDGVKRGVKIAKGAKNASGVEVLSPEDTSCK